MTAATPAPVFRSGAGRLCLDFIRTLRHRGAPGAEEELPDLAAVRAWVVQFAPFAVGEATGEPGQDARARVLREAIYELIDAAVTPAGIESCPSRARETVNELAALPVPAPWLDASGRLRWHADEPVLASLALMARDALDLVTSAAIDRVRRCAGHDCNALFLDSSRPGTRRWCSMNTCGNQAKKDTLRTRRART
ncbi:CGNR zinc finger domain-containing protein [Actinomadura syzygii]|uniref:CGNR zinc finger domain-containing protein n=1 Tax=Actinomadura syzygii TaxID=1427538 RepID=A0A5D0TUZ3_9ACTN|nr:CGNR zinc finger domain-containing protein [Actinomadura syzygii]TYC10008.1 CGNR zinc finger domain-containing protein [Actinomadura syzygii]